MLMLCEDVFIRTSKWLRDRDKIMLTMTCMLLNPLKHKFMYEKVVNYEKIVNLSYFDNFQNLTVTRKDYMRPKYAKSIRYHARTFTEVENIPTGITHITLGNIWSAKWHSVPETVTHLVFRGCFKHASFQNLISPSMTHLELYGNFDKSISDHLPCKLISLKIDDFDQKIEVLPPTLKKLSIGNLNIDTPLLTSLVRLTITKAHDFDPKLEFPHLTHLNLKGRSQICGTYFPVLRHLSTDGVFFDTFPTLTHLTHTTSTFAASPIVYGIHLPVLQYLSTDASLYDDFPMLTHLTYDNKYSPFRSASFPVLTHLIFGKDYDEDLRGHPDDISDGHKVWRNEISFPTLTHLAFGDNFNTKIDIKMFPALTHLTFGNEHDQCIKNSVPRTTTFLKMGYKYNRPISSEDIPLVTQLTLGDCFNQRLTDISSLKLTHLTFGRDFNQPIKPNQLPQSLTHLTFGMKFNQPIDNCIPKSVTYLWFGFCFNQFLGLISSSVSRIELGLCYNKKLSNIPTTTTIILHKDYNHPISSDILSRVKRKN